MNDLPMPPGVPISDAEWEAFVQERERFHAGVAQRKREREEAERQARAEPANQAWFRRFDRRVARGVRRDLRRAEWLAREDAKQALRALVAEQHAPASLQVSPRGTGAARAPRRQPASTSTRTSRGSPDGSSRPAARRALTDDEREARLEEYRRGDPVKVIAQRHGVSHVAIVQLVRRHEPWEIGMRPRGGAW
jgi:hypothetical protein